MNYEQYRRNYVLGGLRRSVLAECPFEQFQQWQAQAIEAGLKDPTAASLASIELDGSLWQRIVLLKHINDTGFVFFTNYDSHKGRALQVDGRAALLFPWNELDRQVSVSGTVKRISEYDSDRYFATRPRASQLGAWASKQSQTIADRATLEAQYARTVSEFDGREVPRPPHWGGFCLEPQIIEFWQGGEHRLHDRFRYRREPEGWRIERLQP